MFIELNGNLAMTKEELLQRIEQAARENATSLALSGNQLTVLPPEINQLTSLKTLKLKDNPLPISPEILSKVDEPATIIT